MRIGRRKVQAPEGWSPLGASSAAKENDATALRLGLGFGYLTNAEQSTQEVPTRMLEAKPEDILDGLYTVLGLAGNKVDRLAHQHGRRELIHSELEFVADALVKLSQGEAVPENPFRQGTEGRAPDQTF